MSPTTLSRVPIPTYASGSRDIAALVALARKVFDAEPDRRETVRNECQAAMDEIVFRLLKQPSVTTALAGTRAPKRPMGRYGRAAGEPGAQGSLELE